MKAPRSYSLRGFSYHFEILAKIKRPERAACREYLLNIHSKPPDRG
jgi:hypothetical protein